MLWTAIPLLGFQSGKYDQVVFATKNFSNFLDSVSLTSRGLKHEPALSPAYLLFLVSSLHKYDLYPSSGRGVPTMRNITPSIFFPSETRSPCAIFGRLKIAGHGTVVLLNTEKHMERRNVSTPCTTPTLGMKREFEAVTVLGKASSRSEFQL